jgi:uncharacterized protein (DUF1800 family)
MNDRDNTQPQPSWQPDNTVPGAAASTGRRRVSRRDVLIGAGGAAIGVAAITTGLLAIKGDIHLGGSAAVTPAPDNQIGHLLRRAGFGAQASDIQEYSALGYDGAVDRLLNYNSIPDNVDQLLQSMNLDLTTPVDEQRWWVVRMIYSKRQFLEKMTLFWHGMLTSSLQKIGGKTGYGRMITQNQFLRDHALDTYDNILLGITQDPAMMWWLDLRLNKAKAPNENYARELMELFTLGVNGGYTQDDVHNGALALTGFTLHQDNTVTYNPALHDNSQKTYLGHTGNLDYKDVIRIVAAHPATGPFVCQRIYRFFVNENPSASDIQTLSSTYYSSGHSIAAVMKALFHLPSFLSAASYRSRVKSPAEFVVGSIRQLGLQYNGQGLAQIMALMGQTIFAPPNVAGWPGDGASANWMNTGTWLARVNLINTVLNGTRASTSSTTIPGVTNIDPLLQATITKNNLHTADDVLNYYVNLLIDGQIDPARRQTLSAYLTASESGGDTLHLVGGQSLSGNNVRGMLYLLMSGPEYQLN